MRATQIRCCDPGVDRVGTGGDVRLPAARRNQPSGEASQSQPRSKLAPLKIAESGDSFHGGMTATQSPGRSRAALLSHPRKSLAETAPPPVAMTPAQCLYKIGATSQAESNRAESPRHECQRQQPPHNSIIRPCMLT
jgi:hypothetical protein